MDASDRRRDFQNVPACQPGTFGTVFQIASIHQQRIGREILNSGGSGSLKNSGCQYSIPEVMCLYSLADKYVLDRASLRGITPLAAEQFNCRFIGRKFVAGSRLISSTSSSVRWLSTSTPADCQFHHQRNQDDKAAHSHREEIQQRAARGVFAVLHHLSTWR